MFWQAITPQFYLLDQRWISVDYDVRSLTLEPPRHCVQQLGLDPPCRCVQQPGLELPLCATVHNHNKGDVSDITTNDINLSSCVMGHDMHFNTRKNMKTLKNITTKHVPRLYSTNNITNLGNSTAHVKTTTHIYEGNIGYKQLNSHTSYFDRSKWCTVQTIRTCAAGHSLCDPAKHLKLWGWLYWYISQCQL
jgi:hypothetical protein